MPGEYEVQIREGDRTVGAPVTVQAESHRDALEMALMILNRGQDRFIDESSPDTSEPLEWATYRQVADNVHINDAQRALVCKRSSVNPIGT